MVQRLQNKEVQVATVWIEEKLQCNTINYMYSICMCQHILALVY